MLDKISVEGQPQSIMNWQTDEIIVCTMYNTREKSCNVCFLIGKQTETWLCFLTTVCFCFLFYMINEESVAGVRVC